jgi:hypothetical protein
VIGFSGIRSPASTTFEISTTSRSSFGMRRALEIRVFEVRDDDEVVERPT